MKTTMMKAAGLLGLLALSGLVLAGALDPPGPPSPTMVTLQQIYDKISGGLAKTGQVTCTDTAGNPINCAGTGQDGALQKGVSVSPRFTDNGDGTVKDNLTGLVWLKNANCFGQRTWSQALTDANGLASGACSLTDGSVAGAWRLPNARELQSLINLQITFPALTPGHPFTGVQSIYTWTSTTYVVPGQQNYGIAVHMGNGYVQPDIKTSPWYVWPVRGGQ
jgi:uncharacterized protein DUF1566